MHHADHPHSASGGNRPAKGARIVDTQAGLGAQGAREDAVDFLGLDGLELAPMAARAVVQDQLDAVLGTPADAAPRSSERVRLLQPGASSARADAEAPKLATYAAAPVAAGRRATFVCVLLLVAAAGGAGLWSWRAGAASGGEPSIVVEPATIVGQVVVQPSVAPARTGASRSARPGQPTPVRQADWTEPALVRTQPATSKQGPAEHEPVGQAQPAVPQVESTPDLPALEAATGERLSNEAVSIQSGPIESTKSESLPSDVARSEASTPELVAIQVAATEVSASHAAPVEPSVAAPASESSTAVEARAAPKAIAALAPPHAAIAARLQLERRFAARHGRSPLAVASVLPRPAWPAGDGATLTPEAVDAPRLVRDFAPAEPSVPGGPRRVAPDAFGSVHPDADIPLEALHGAKRLLTPKVGEVRVLLRSGETFEGRLHALGEGGAWLDTDLGRMLLHESQVRGIEALATGAAGGGASRGGLDQAPRVRVVCAGGVFTGALVSRQGDEVVLATDEGSRIKLKALKVESVSREGTQVRGRVQSKPKD